MRISDWSSDVCSSDLLPSVIEAALFPRLIGWGRTAWLLYRGDTIDAATAERWGLVEKVVPPAELDAAVEELVGVLLRNGPTGMRLQKRLMQDWERLPLDRKSTRLNSSHSCASRMPSYA